MITYRVEKSYTAAISHPERGPGYTGGSTPLYEGTDAQEAARVYLAARGGDRIGGGPSSSAPTIITYLNQDAEGEYVVLRDRYPEHARHANLSSAISRARLCDLHEIRHGETTITV